MGDVKRQQSKEKDTEPDIGIGESYHPGNDVHDETDR